MSQRTPWLAGLSGRDLYGAAAEERHSARTESDGRRGYRAPADRPRPRRSAEEDTAPARVTSRIRGLSLRDSSGDGGLLTYEGHASVTDTGYEMWDYFGPYTEQVTSGAFGLTLARADLDVPLVLQHADLRRIARTTNGSLQLAEDDGGLHVLAPALDPEDRDVAYIVPKLRSGLVDEMSFKFMITKGQWSPDWMEYHIDEVDIHRGDVAIVGYGANPHTAGSGLRSVPTAADLARSLSDDQALELHALLAERVRTPRSLITDADVRTRALPA
jgi:HK97 family phage prohead protease